MHFKPILTFDVKNDLLSIELLLMILTTFSLFAVWRYHHGQQEVKPFRLCHCLLWQNTCFATTSIPSWFIVSVGGSCLKWCTRSVILCSIFYSGLSAVMSIAICLVIAQIVWELSQWLGMKVVTWVLQGTSQWTAGQDFKKHCIMNF